LLANLPSVVFVASGLRIRGCKETASQSVGNCRDAAFTRVIRSRATRKAGRFGLADGMVSASSRRPGDFHIPSDFEKLSADEARHQTTIRAMSSIAGNR